MICISIFHRLIIGIDHWKWVKVTSSSIIVRPRPTIILNIVTIAVKSSHLNLLVTDPILDMCIINVLFLFFLWEVERWLKAIKGLLLVFLFYVFLLSVSLFNLLLYYSLFNLLLLDGILSLELIWFVFKALSYFF